MQLISKNILSYLVSFSNKRKGLQIGFTLFLLIFLSQSAVQAQSISVTDVLVTPVCAGSDVTVTFDTYNGKGTKNYYDSGTTYIVYLSDPTGTAGWTEINRFTNTSFPYAGGNDTKNSGIQQIVTIPASTIFGAGYRIAVGSTGPTFDAVTGAGASNNPFTITALPTITGTTSGSRTGTGTVVLGADASTGTINWYAAATAGGSLGTGSSFTTLPISTTTTYYVDATTVNGCTTTMRTAIVATVYTPSDYRSIASGNWNSLATWQRFNGSIWEALTGVAPLLLPTSDENTITIRNGHTVTVTAAATIDQCIVELGGQVTVNSGITWTIDDGTGIDLSVDGKILNAGTITTSGTFQCNTGATLDLGTGIINGSGSFVLNSGAGIITAHPQGLSTTAGTGNIQLTGTKTYSATANFTYNGIVAQRTGNGLSAASNLTIDNAIGVVQDNNILVSGTLTINASKKLEVSAGKELSVTGTITNNAGTSGLVLQSDATGTASLMHNSDNIPATVQRYISGPVEGWHFLSSPVFNQGISGSWLPVGSYGTGNPATGTGYDLYLWDEPSFSFKYKLDVTPMGWNSVHPGIDFSVGRGYLYSVQAVNPTKEFLGDLNNGPINYPITSTITDPLDPDRAFNLVGNPYPSSVDWQAASGWDRTKLENSVGGHDMWVWNPTANNYGVFNSASGVGTNSINRYLAPMQGYFIKASGDGNLGFDNAVRVHTGAGNWFKNAGIKNGVIRLSVQSEEGSGADEALIQFGYSDSKQGASKLFSHVATAPSLYMSSNKEDYSVRYMTDTAENKSVPLEFKAGKDGFYNLAFNFDSKEFDFVQLEDRFSKITTAINPSTVYRFKALEKNGSSRFVLHFSEADTAIDKELTAMVYMDGSHLAVDLKAVDVQTEVTVFDVSGKLILRKDLEGSAVHMLNVNKATQILLVRLKNEKGRMNTKILYTPLK